MMVITIDIETDYSHDPSVIERVCSKVTPPANYKSEEAIEKWWATTGGDKKVEAQRKTALDPLWGSIRMIGYKVNDNPVEVITGAESGILTAFYRVLAECLSEDGREIPVIVGHNVKNFDLDFIRKRGIITGNRIHDWMNVYYTRYCKDIFDTMEEFAGWNKYVKLDDLAYALLGETKNGDGAASLDMTDEECIQYCKSDVALTYKIYQLMTGAK